jgi:hypothetical protein
VKQQEEPQSMPQVEQEKTPQVQVKTNHEDGGDLMMMKKTRRGGKARHQKFNQDTKMMSKTQDEKELAHIKYHACEDLDHLASGCPNKLEKKAQANKEKQDNGKHNTSKEEKAQSKRKRKGYFS